MRMGEAGRALVGAVAVYVAMAACSAASETREKLSSGGASGQSAGGSAGTAEDSSVLDAFADAALEVYDAATDPVGDAQAAPIVVTANCDLEWDVGAGSFLIAEAQFPGKTVNDLASVITYRKAGPGETLPDGYGHMSVGHYLRDGYVAVSCGPDSSGPYDTVTFVLP